MKRTLAVDIDPVGWVEVRNPPWTIKAKAESSTEAVGFAALNRTFYTLSGSVGCILCTTMCVAAFATIGMISLSIRSGREALWATVHGWLISVKETQDAQA